MLGSFSCNLLQELSPHALYMRLKRLCSRTSAGKLNVAPEVHTQWQEGDRDQLTYALVRALKQHGLGSDKSTRDAVRAWSFEKFWKRLDQSFFWLLIKKIWMILIFISNKPWNVNQFKSGFIGSGLVTGEILWLEIICFLPIEPLVQPCPEGWVSIANHENTWAKQGTRGRTCWWLVYGGKNAVRSWLQ